MIRSDKKYSLSFGTQVRQEDFGLLFYTMKGPRLYFLPVKSVLDPDFFKGKHSLSKWLENNENNPRISDRFFKKIEKSLNQLIDKGVLFEC